MKDELTIQELDQLLPKIKAVIQTGKRWEDEQLHHPAGAIIDAVLAIPGMKKGEEREDDRGSEAFDSNGWQWDWWQRFDYKGKSYTLSGSGYYGGHSSHVSDE